MNTLTWREAMIHLHPLAFSNGTMNISGSKHYVDRFTVGRLSLEQLQFLQRFDNVKIQTRGYAGTNVKHEVVYLIH